MYNYRLKQELESQEESLSKHLCKEMEKWSPQTDYRGPWTWMAVREKQIKPFFTLVSNLNVAFPSNINMGTKSQ